MANDEGPFQHSVIWSALYSPPSTGGAFGTMRNRDFTRFTLARRGRRRYTTGFGGLRSVRQEGSQERREVYFSGRVQGVGFRYTVRTIAARFAVTGFVKNLSDGRVQLVVEGPAEQLRGILDAVNAEMGRYITGTQQESSPATGRFRNFDIRF